MKIGIFGDSYAALRLNTKQPIMDWSWVSLLNHDYDCDNHACSGTSYDWTYYQFLNHYQKYDIVIVLQTSMFRSTVFGEVNDNNDILSMDNKIEGIEPKLPFNHNGLEHDLLMNSGHFHADGNTYENKVIYDGLLTMTAEYRFHNMMLHHAISTSIHALHDNVIHLQCFDETNRNRICMHNITRLDRTAHNALPAGNYIEDPTKRANHLSKQQSYEFYSYMKDAIDNGFNITNTLKDPGKFYTTSTTLEDSGFIIK